MELVIDFPVVKIFGKTTANNKTVVRPNIDISPVEELVNIGSSATPFDISCRWWRGEFSDVGSFNNR